MKANALGLTLQPPVRRRHTPLATAGCAVTVLELLLFTATSHLMSQAGSSHLVLTVGVFRLAETPTTATAALDLDHYCCALEKNRINVLFVYSLWVLFYEVFLFRDAQ